MKFGKLLSITLLACSLLLGFPSRAQSVYMQNHDTVYLYNCREHSGNIFIPTTTSLYSDETIDSWAIIYTYGQPLSISYNTLTNASSSNEACWIEMVGQDTAVTYYAYETASIAPITFQGDSLVIHFHRAPFTMHTLYFTWTCPAAFVCADLPSGYVANITATTADLFWQCQTFDTAIIDCGPLHLVTSDHNVHVTGLQPNTRYELLIRSVADSNHSCCAYKYIFHTDAKPCIGVPDMQDLGSYYCLCHSGYFSYPYQTVGRIDFGPGQIESRHTLHLDTTETDPRTGGLLHTVCPGTSKSVRLGNWNSGRGAESVSYKLHVDTLIYSLLILRYAVVLQNPNHTSSEQPRFRLEILDTNWSVIDPNCGAADFIANDTLGWNTYEPVNTIWKNWTTVGFDLTPYHNQTIILRFTTFDCNLGAHYGYAYYYAECIPRSVASESCGPVDSNSVTAPDGFLYTWYTSSPDNVLSTEQSYTFLTFDAYIYCLLTSTENSQCHVTMSAYTGNRWPHAVADTIAATNTCQGYTVTFVDQSNIVNSQGQPRGEHGESRRWYFDDGDSSTLVTPQHTFLNVGWHQVTLVSGIAGDLCTDTTVFYVYAPPRVFTNKTDTLVACDSLLFTDGHWYFRDTSFHQIHHMANCDSIDYFNFFIHPSFLTDSPADTFCYTHTYTWRGQTVGQIGTDSALVIPLADSLVSAYGCDSIYTITLVQLGRPQLSIDHKSDCIHKTYRLTAHSPLPYIHWEAEPDDSLLDGHRSDSIVTVMPDITSLYILTTDYRDLPFCPTRDTVTLRPVTLPEALLSVQPETINIDYPTLIASDLSVETSSRSWQLLYYPDGLDTLFLSDTLGTLLHNLGDLTIDSLQVILSVSNDICYDTARRTVPVVRALLWAPNVFTPGESTNNRFSIIGVGLLQAELSIYNRAGLLVYRTDDLDTGWDGTREGQPCSQAAYVWHLRYRTSTYPDTWQSATGIITLLR